jgi:hypothetical protein
MTDKPRCQSCGMPLLADASAGTSEQIYGTNADGSVNREWCKFCFANGAFTTPDLTVEQMVQRSVDFMSTHLGIPVERAREQSSSVIPRLRRWTNEAP